MAVEDRKTFSEAWQHCDKVSGSKGKLFEPNRNFGTNDVVKEMYRGKLTSGKSWTGIIEYDSRNFVYHSDVTPVTWDNWRHQRNESRLPNPNILSIVSELSNMINSMNQPY